MSETQTSKNVITEERQKIIEACHLNAEKLIHAAKSILAANSAPSAAYHLALLAIEETGKAPMLKIGGITAYVGNPNQKLENKLDDHAQKLFWAFWLPRLSGKMMTKEEFEDCQKLAIRMHNKRLASLYVSPDQETALLEISKEEAEGAIRLAEALLKLEEAFVFNKLDETKVDDYKWFLAASVDEEKRKFIFTNATYERLIQTEDMFDWVKWVRSESEKREQEMMALLKKELDKNIVPIGEDYKRDEKWQVKIKLICLSHSIRQKELNGWNDQMKINGIRLVEGDKKKKELIIEFTYPSALHLKALWPVSYGETRRLLLSLSIGAMGFFWWYSLNRELKFFETMRDLENDKGVVFEERSSFLYIEWGQRVLTSQDLNRASLCLINLPGPDGPLEEQRPFGHYFHGLAFLAKTDLHLNVTPHAAREFFESLKSGMKFYGAITEEGEFYNALDKHIESIVPIEQERTAFIELAKKLKEKGEQSFPELTMDKVLQLKILCDLFFLKQFEKKMETKIQAQKSEQILEADKAVTSTKGTA